MLSDAQRTCWLERGYLALPGFFGPGDVAAVSALVESVFREPPPWLVVDNTVTGTRCRLIDVPRHERSPRMYKLNDLYLESAAVRDLAFGSRLRPILNELLGTVPVLCNSLNFEKGSQQPEHIDSLFMTPQTPGGLAATWIALEDAHPDAGQLFYYPGSHTIPLYTFRDGTHHAQSEELPAWHDYIQAELVRRKLPCEQFAARKGDLFIWSANLVHGGSPIRDPQRTRRSLVCHYYTLPDCERQGVDLVPQGDDGMWLRRPHPALPERATLRRTVGRWLRRAGLRKSA